MPIIGDRVSPAGAGMDHTWRSLGSLGIGVPHRRGDGSDEATLQKGREKPPSFKRGMQAPSPQRPLTMFVLIYYTTNMEPKRFKMYGIRFPMDIYHRIKALAEAEHRSFTAQVIYILVKYLEQVKQ